MSDELKNLYFIECLTVLLKYKKKLTKIVDSVPQFQLGFFIKNIYILNFLLLLYFVAQLFPFYDFFTQTNKRKTLCNWSHTKTRKDKLVRVTTFKPSVCDFLIERKKAIFLTSLQYCPAFVERISQSSPVANTYTILVSKTNRNTNALGNNRFHRDRHNEVISYCSQHSFHRSQKLQHVFVNIAGMLGNLALAVRLYWLLLSCIRLSWDKIFQPLTCWPIAVTTNSHRPSSDNVLADNE